MASYLHEGSCSEYINEIQKLHNTNTQLKKENSQLFQELGSLRDQIREISEKNKEKEKENNEQTKIKHEKLEEKIKDLEKEKNDLSNQLQLAQKEMENLKEKQIQEKEMSKSTSRKSNEPSIHEINNSKTSNLYFTDSNMQNMYNESQSQITQLTDDNKELTRNLNEQIKKNAQLKQNNKIILETFSNYFQKKFQSITQLLNYIKKEGKNTPKNSNKKIEQEKPKKYTQASTESINKPKLDVEKLNLEAELKKIENEVIKYKNEVKTNEMKNKQEMEEKNKKISTLENENSFLKKQIIEMNSALNPIPLTFNLQDSTDQDSKLVKLQQALAETNKQLQSTQNENKDINRQLTNVKSDNEELFNKIEEKNQEIVHLRIERDDYEGKYNATFAQVEIEKTNNQKLSSSLNDISRKLGISQETIRNFEKFIASQKEEISKLTNDRNSLSTLVFKIKDLFQKEEEIYQKLLSENKSYKKDLKSIKNTINTIKNKTSNDKEISNSIPITSWYSLDFEEDLCKLISEVASNEGISDIVKLKYVFQIIAKYYKRQIDDLKNEKKKELDKQEFQSTISTNFIISVAKQLGVNDVDSDFITNPLKISDFQQNLSSLINECENLRKSNEYQTNLLNMISVKLNATYEEIPEKIDAANKLVNNLQAEKSNTFNQQKSEKQEYKKKIELLNSKYTKLNEKKDSVIAKLKSQNARLSNQVTKLTESMKELSNSQNKPATSIKTSNRLMEELDEIKFYSSQSLSNNNANDKNSEEESVSELSSKIAEQESLIQIKDKEIARLEDEVFFWKQNLEAVKTLQSKKEADLQKNQDNQEEVLMTTKKRFQNEKDEISKQYELVISNIKKQNLELKNVIETMSASISKNETKMNQVKQKNLQLIKEKEQLTNQLVLQKEELKRQISINSQKLKACQIVTESSQKNAIADMQLQFYSEKRKIFSFAIQLFSSFYNNEKKIDEDVYKDTLTKASNALQKLTAQDKSVRELLGLSNNESVETNVSILLKKLFNQA